MSSNQILVTFSSKWEEAIRKGRVSVIYRKVIPNCSDINGLYVYINAPVSSVIGSFELLDFKYIQKNEAIKLVDAACIDRAELDDYLGASTKIGVYVVSKFAPFARPVNLLAIRRSTAFYPPQNFKYLDESIINSINKAQGELH